MRWVWLWREEKVGREREEVLESEGKRVLESWKESLEEVLGGIREVKEEDTFERWTTKPWKIEESKRDRGPRNRTWWRTNFTLFYHLHCVSHGLQG